MTRLPAFIVGLTWAAFGGWLLFEIMTAHVAVALQTLEALP